MGLGQGDLGGGESGTEGSRGTWRQGGLEQRAWPCYYLLWLRLGWLGSHYCPPPPMRLE